MPGTGNLTSYPGLVKLEENLQSPVFKTSTISNPILRICPYTTAKCCPYPLSRNFAIDKDSQKTTANQNIELWSPVPTDNIYNSTLAPEAQGLLQNRGWKVCKNQRKGFVVRLCLLGISEATLTASSHQLSS